MTGLYFFLCIVSYFIPIRVQAGKHVCPSYGKHALKRSESKKLGTSKTGGFGNFSPKEQSKSYSSKSAGAPWENGQKQGAYQKAKGNLPWENGQKQGAYQKAKGNLPWKEEQPAFAKPPSKQKENTEHVDINKNPPKKPNTNNTRNPSSKKQNTFSGILPTKEFDRVRQSTFEKQTGSESKTPKKN